MCVKGSGSERERAEGTGGVKRSLYREPKEETEEGSREVRGACSGD